MKLIFVTKNQTCQHCGTKFDADNRRKFCSKACYSLSQVGKLAIPNMVGKRGIKPKIERSVIKCIICNKNVEQRVTENKKYCSKKCWSVRNPKKIYGCLSCQSEFTDYESNHRKFCNKKCADSYRMSHPEIYTPLILEGKYNSNKFFKNTYIEIIIQNLLKKNNIDFIPSYVFNGKFEIDVFIPVYNIAIECDGDYWHSSTEQKTKDKKKDKYLKVCGIKVIRLKEKTIVKNQRYCLKKIMLAIKSKN